MENRLSRIEARISALEWALERLPTVLAGEAGIPEKSVPQWLHCTVEAALKHGVVSQSVHDAVNDLADRMLEIPEDYPEFLKQLRRDGL